MPVLSWQRTLGKFACTALGLLAALAQAAPEEECSCLWQGSFAEVQAQVDLVAAVTVLGGKGNSLDVTVDRILRGREFKEEVRLWLKARDYCRPEAKEFPVGTRWVLALYRITEEVPGGFNPDTPNLSYGRIDDYRLSSCGGYWLEIQEDRVTGNLVDAPRWERAPKMTPVLLELLAAYIRGEVDSEALLEASREDPALRELMLDTREFLRQIR
ncbi:delta-aminolevulinic acid dehydratase [Haliea sp. E1-2-M8]|uniref:delta-aminolevulinic acid dehydratase n=1 Tax=Haliea sp. E1-2-M8 TaxID=3064706 RepID=UPI00271E924D|nr:delta-aminolevulinic acid dehydratase [Haliea sp. E1-2-M8]MDO8863858.1 delta-aminolevulinic acid dehydratase [Haliea sp. E1-2-M8]